MTEQEAIEIMEEVKTLDDSLYAYDPAYMEALEIAISASKEVQRYRKIGTVEECRKAVEKQKAMKPKEILRHRGGFEEYHCPNCNSNFLKDERYAIKEGYCSACGKLLDSRFRNYCANCGQAIENENLEEMENE